MHSGNVVNARTKKVLDEALELSAEDRALVAGIDGDVFTKATVLQRDALTALLDAMDRELGKPGAAATRWAKRVLTASSSTPAR